jgi:hypothetical protein
MFYSSALMVAHPFRSSGGKKWGVDFDFPRAVRRELWALAHRMRPLILYSANPYPLAPPLRFDPLLSYVVRFLLARLST